MVNDWRAIPERRVPRRGIVISALPPARPGTEVPVWMPAFNSGRRLSKYPAIDARAGSGRPRGAVRSSPQ